MSHVFSLIFCVFTVGIIFVNAVEIYDLLENHPLPVMVDEKTAGIYAGVRNMIRSQFREQVPNIDKLNNISLFKICYSVMMGIIFDETVNIGTSAIEQQVLISSIDIMEKISSNPQLQKSDKLDLKLLETTPLLNRRIIQFLLNENPEKPSILNYKSPSIK